MFRGACLSSLSSTGLLKNIPRAGRSSSFGLLLPDTSDPPRLHGYRAWLAALGAKPGGLSASFELTRLHGAVFRPRANRSTALYRTKPGEYRAGVVNGRSDSFQDCRLT